MFHPTAMFTDPSHATLGLEDLKLNYRSWLRGRAKPAKPPTVNKAMYSIDKLIAYMARSEMPLELRYLHHFSVNGWIAESRALGQSEDGISSTLASIKAFANSFLTRHAELCIADPLRKVARITPPDKEMPVLDKDECEDVLKVFSDLTFEDVRNKAFFAVLLATGARLGETRELALDQWDAAADELTLFGKGDRIRYAILGDRPAKLLRAYLRLRPKHRSHQLWLQRTGVTLSEHGWNDVMRRFRVRLAKTNPDLATRVHFHLLRHTFGTIAIDKGAERAAVQDMMGHTTDAMTMRYTRAARKRTAAKMMPQYSPI